ncbi:MAG TPA: 6-phosphofructokinase, partial [bacterium]|nr:6-phosphofructokinase [bacterium]
LRCADPIPFDQEYTRDLGFQAVRYLLNDGNSYKGNAMISVDNGKLHPIPFDEIIDKATQKTAVRYVDIHSDSYRVARSYMVRLEKRDLEDKEFLAKLAAAARMTPKQFIERFAYLI